MDWQQLKGFYHVATLGNITKAAEAVFRTQSALSQQIKALETSLDCRLFERIGKKSMVLTAEGEALLLFAQDVLGRHARFMRDLASIKVEHSGRVTIGAAPTVAHSVLPELLVSFRQAFPRITVTVYAKNPEETLPQVKNGFLDLGMNLESMIPESFVTHRWRKNRYMLMTLPDHPLAGMTPPKLEDIFTYPIIVLSNSKFAARYKFEATVSRMGLCANIVLESDNAMMSVEYVKRGLGICFMSMPEAVPRTLIGQLACIPLDDYFEPEYIAIYHRKDALSKAAEAFLNVMLLSAENTAEDRLCSEIGVTRG